MHTSFLDTRHFRLGAFFLCFLSFSLVLGACGEQEKVYSIGLYSNVGQPGKIEGLKEGLKALGYTEGKNIRFFELKTVGLSPDQEQSALRDFAAKNYDAYWVEAGSGAEIFKPILKQQPMVVAGMADPVARGLIENLDRPGNNISGIDSQNTSLTTKRLNWLAKLDPSIKQVYLLYDPKNSSQASNLEAVRAEANRLGLTLLERTASTKDEIKSTVLSLKRSEAPAVILIGISFLNTAPQEFKTVVNREKLVLAGGDPSHLENGALFSYGGNFMGIGRQSAIYVDKVLHGTDPATLPVAFPNKIDLILNQKLADQLGRTFPSVLLEAAADTVK